MGLVFRGRGAFHLNDDSIGCGIGGEPIDLSLTDGRSISEVKGNLYIKEPIRICRSDCHLLATRMRMSWPIDKKLF